MINNYNNFLLEKKLLNENLFFSWKKLLDKILKEYNLNLYFSGTFGLVVTATLPLFYELIENSNLKSLSKQDVIFLVLATLVQYFKESKNNWNKLYIILKEKKLDQYLDQFKLTFENITNIMKLMLIKLGKSVKNTYDIFTYTAISTAILYILSQFINQHNLNFENFLKIFKGFSISMGIGGGLITLKYFIELLWSKLSDKLNLSKKERDIKLNESLNEGLNNIVLGILMLLNVNILSASNQDSTSKINRKTFDKNTAENMVKQGFTLDSTKIDTIISIIKDADVVDSIETIELIPDVDLLFNSGSYNINDTIKHDIDEIFSTIEDDLYILLKIEIESSTDKQLLKLNLQNDLKNKGYEPNNQGLSELRSDKISEYITSKYNVNNDIIFKDNKYEQGNDIIDKNYRYVKIRFYIVKSNFDDIMLGAIKKTDYKKTYYLSKEFETNILKKLNRNLKNKHKVCKIPKKNFKDYNLKTLKCPDL